MKHRPLRDEDERVCRCDFCPSKRHCSTPGDINCGFNDPTFEPPAEPPPTEDEMEAMYQAHLEADSLSDAEALASAGRGTDEDYGGDACRL
jgi:hypothetical protein